MSTLCTCYSNYSCRNGKQAKPYRNIESYTDYRYNPIIIMPVVEIPVSLEFICLF